MSDEHPPIKKLLRWGKLGSGYSIARKEPNSAHWFYRDANGTPHRIWFGIASSQECGVKSVWITIGKFLFWIGWMFDKAAFKQESK